MSTATMPATERPLPKLPSSANKSDVWRDREGVLQEHPGVEMPVDPKTKKINGKLYACINPLCATAEWVIEPATEPKMKFCPNDAAPLSFVPLDDTQQDPIATGRHRQLARIADVVARKRSAAAARIRTAAAVQAAVQAKQAAPEQIAKLAGDMKGHYPSLAATAAVEVGVIYTVDLTGAVQSLAIATAIGTWGAVVGYFVAVYVCKLRARLRKEGFEGRAAKKARERGLWTGRALVSTGTFLAVTGAVEGLAGLDPTSWWQWSLLSLLGLGLAWFTNRAHWEQLWADRRRIRELAEENARRAAEAEAARLEEEARRAAEAARRHEQLATAEITDPDNPEHQGRLMAIEWDRISNLDTAAQGFPKIKKTQIVPEKTREITAPDPETGKPMRIGWEYQGKCEPGALVVGSGMVPAIMSARDWLVSVLYDGQYDSSAISLVDMPDGKQNTFLIMITERARLGDAVPWRAERAVRRDHNGVRYGYLGRSLTGDELEEIMYAPTKPLGGLVTGTTGGGKGGFLIRYLLNCLFSGILPVLFDPKGLVDFADFIGLFPIGFTKRHRRIIMESMHAERARRQSRLAAAPKTNRYGAVVAGESRWNTHDEATGEIGVYGEPIVTVFDEFHDMAKDAAFVLDLTNHVRLERAVAMGVLLASQGGGLDDWGNSVLRELGSMTSRTNFRGGDMQARLSGARSKYSTADLPAMPGMCLREAPGSPDVPLRAAFISRNPDDEDTVFTTLWGKGTEPVMQIPDPMDWISDETKALWEQTGLMELWRMARGPGGLERLLADTQEDEEDEEDEAPAGKPSRANAVALPTEKAVAPSRMTAREVVLAILHETPGIDRKGVETSDVWLRAPGWAKLPDPATVSRAANDLDPSVGGTKPLAEGRVPKIDRGPNSSSWTLTPAGAKAGAAAAAQLASPVTTRQVGQPAHVSAMSIAEMAAQQAAEMAEMIARESAMANRRG